LRSVSHLPARQSLTSLTRHWATRSFIAGLVSTSADFALLICLVERAHVAPVQATALAVAFGGALNFVLNKYVAIRDRDPHVASQFARFSVGVSISLVLHAALVFSLTQRFGLHYLAAKLIGDAFVFTLSHPLLLRYVVFPEQRRLSRDLGHALACVSLMAALVGAPILPCTWGAAATWLSAGQAHGDLSGQVAETDATPQLELASQGALLPDLPLPESAQASGRIALPPEAPYLSPQRRPPRA